MSGIAKYLSNISTFAKLNKHCIHVDIDNTYCILCELECIASFKNFDMRCQLDA